MPAGRPRHEDHRRRDLLDPHPVRHGRQARHDGRPQLADDEHGLAAHRHRPGAGRLGRGLRPRLRGNHDGRAEHATRPRRPRPGRARHRRAAPAPVEGVPRLRPQRRARVRAVRARHRAVGHRRQGRRPAAVAAVRRDAGRAAHLLCQPAALRRGLDGRRRLRTCHRRLATATSSCTRSPSPRSAPRARRSAPRRG